MQLDSVEDDDSDDDDSTEVSSNDDYSFDSIPTAPQSIPTLAEIKSYVFTNIPTADSRPPIFSTDTTAGPYVWDNDDDDSTTEYDSFDILSHSCLKKLTELKAAYTPLHHPFW